MANKHQALIDQIQTQIDALDKLVDADDIALAMSIQELNNKMNTTLDRMNRAGIDVEAMRKRNNETHDKINQFIGEFG